MRDYGDIWTEWETNGSHRDENGDPIYVEFSCPYLQEEIECFQCLYYDEEEDECKHPKKGGKIMKYEKENIIDKEEEEEYEDKDEDSIPEWQRGFFGYASFAAIPKQPTRNGENRK